MADPKSLQDAIENLSAKKHVISDAALQARQLSSQQMGNFDKNHAVLNEFNQSIKLLMSVFRESNFDQFLVLAGKPGRLMTLQLLMGLIIGVGFTLGVIILGAISAYILNLLYPGLIHHTLLMFISK
jgi:hypothetical protein